MPQGRFKFVDWFGMPRGLNNTNNLQEAIKTADDFQCEVIDTANENQPVYNCWSGWQEEWRQTMKYNIILRNGRYALLEMETQYVVACGFDETLPENQQWSQGYYYSHWNTSEIVKQRMLSAALEYYRTLTETDYIPRCRLEELATQFKDGLIEDDEESAMEYFNEVCEMTESEKEFFGIKTESDEEEYEEEYCPSSTHGDYSPSCPWNAPGMSIKDFI